MMELHLAFLGGDILYKKEWWNKVNAWMVQLNKHFHVYFMTNTALSQQNLLIPLHYSTSWNSTNFIPVFLWRYILKEIFYFLDIIKMCETAVSWSLPVILSLVLCQRQLHRRGQFTWGPLILQNTNGAAPENPAQGLRVVNSEVRFCCCWSQKALKMGIVNVFFFF